jgi:hypothetical protein
MSSQHETNKTYILLVHRSHVEKKGEISGDCVVHNVNRTQNINRNVKQH